MELSISKSILIKDYYSLIQIVNINPIAYFRGYHNVNEVINNDGLLYMIYQLRPLTFCAKSDKVKTDKTNLYLCLN